MTTEDLQILRRQLIRDEGLRHTPYRCPAGALTIGVGYNISARGWAPLERVIGRQINKNRPRLETEEALAVLDADITEIDAAITARWPWTAALAAPRRRALINMGFMGVSKLAGFRRMLAALEAGDFNRASDEALDSKWQTDVGPYRSSRVATMLRLGIDA